MDWDSQFLNRSPMFAPLNWSGAVLSKLPDWPSHADYQRLLNHIPHIPLSANGKPIAFVPQSKKRNLFIEKYEPQIFLTGQVQTRLQNWHDLFNALVWLTFPKTKALVNELHFRELEYLEDVKQATNRGPLQDAITLFDEGGIVVASSDEELIALLRQHRWKELFWHKRARVISNMQFFLFGHALYEKALAPYVGVTGKGLIFSVEESFHKEPLHAQLNQIDIWLACFLRDGRMQSTADLAPVPVLGIPGWSPENEQEAYYDNTEYFRIKRFKKVSA